MSLAAALAAASTAAHAATYAVEIGVGLPEQRGHLQTAAGGEPGTSSARRPTLAEIGLKAGDYRWAAGTLAFGSYALAMRYTVIGDVGNASLRESLISQGQTFPAGAQVRSRFSLDGLAFSAARTFTFDGGTTLAIGPWIGWTGFDLKVDGARHRVDRSYRVYALGALASISREPGPRLRLGAEAVAAPAFNGAASRFYIEPSLGYRLGETFDVKLSFRIGTFRYDDGHKQVWPNRLRVDRRVPAVSVRWQP